MLKLQRTASWQIAVSAALVLMLVPALAWVVRNLPPLPPGTIGRIDSPGTEATVETHLRISGWALDPAHIARIEVRVDGQHLLARTGLPRPNVAARNSFYPD